MIEPAGFSRLLGKLSDTLLAPEAFPAFMADLMEMGGCTRAGVLSKGSGGHLRTFGWTGFDPEHIKAYDTHYHKQDLLLQRPAGDEPFAFTQRNAEAHWPAFSRSAFYNDWAVPSGVRHVAFAGVPTPAGQATLLLGWTDAVPPAAGPLELLRLIAPHVQRTAALAAQMQALQRRSEALLAALDLWSFGAVLLDARGRLLHANAAAEAMARLDDGLQLGAQGLRATERQADRALAAMVGGLAAGTGAAAVVVVPRPSLAHAFVVHGFPLAAHAPGPWGEGCGEDAALLLVIVDPSRSAPTREALVRAVFGLTTAEARVALRMAEGNGLPAVAEEMGVSHATARSHLQRAFDKTGGHRQSELAVLLARIAADFPSGVRPAPAPRPGRPGPGSRSG